jgi:serine protease Do
MRCSLVLVWLVLLAACGDAESPPRPTVLRSSEAPSASLNDSPAPDFAALVQRLGPTVVNVSTGRSTRALAHGLPESGDDNALTDLLRRLLPGRPWQPQRPQSLGSGFIVSADGYILTNAHLVGNQREAIVKLDDRREFTGRVVGIDARTDVALLKINGDSLAVVSIGDPKQVKVGEWVAAIGSPFGFENSVTAGIISAKGRQLPDEDWVPFLQTDVPINPGNSGGPLFNTRGEVIGMNSLIYSENGGYIGLSFAIPIDVAMQVAEQLRSRGKVVRGRLGVRIQEVSAGLARSFQLEHPAGALVAEVEVRSPAAGAGLKAGDVILRFDGLAIESAGELPQMIAGKRPGTDVRMDIWRRGQAMQLHARIAQADTPDGYVE